MGIIKWRDSFNTGVEQFDGEHRRIIDLIDQMYQVVRGKGNKEQSLKACKRIMSYTEDHFSNEEKAMRETDYPGLDEQLTAHVELTAEASRLTERIESGDPDGEAEFYQFLRRWWIEHIQGMDMAYSDHFEKSGDA